MTWYNRIRFKGHGLGRWHMVGFWDRLLVGPVWRDSDGGLWIGVGHRTVGLWTAGDVLQLLVCKVLHGQVLASMLAPGNGRRRQSWFNGQEWQVGFLIGMWLWHGDDWWRDGLWDGHDW